jgi:hypothetical protein
MACLVGALSAAVIEREHPPPTVRDAAVQHRLGLESLCLKPHKIGHDVLAGAVCERRPDLPAHLLEVVPNFLLNPLRQSKLQRLVLCGGFCFCLRLWYWYWLWLR